MYIYRIIAGEYEYQRTFLLSHETKYNKEEFKSIVQGAVRYLKNKNLNFNDDWEVFDVLLNIYGFKKYSHEYQACLSFDWCISQILK